MAENDNLVPAPKGLGRDAYEAYRLLINAQIIEPNTVEARLRRHAVAPFGFDIAMMFLRDGGRVRRSGWPEGHYLERHMLPEGGAEIRYVVGSDAGWQGAEVGRLYIVGSTAEGKWIVTMTAICAEDWQTAP